MTKGQIVKKQFAKEFVKNGFNGKRAYMTVKKAKDNNATEVSASRLLSNPKVKQSIIDLLPKDDVETGIIKEALNSKRPQDISWKDLRGYTELSLKLKGHLGSESNKPSVNVGIVINP